MADTCEARGPSTGEPICRRVATHIHPIRDEDGEVYEEMYICEKHARGCKRCRPMVKESTDR